jgi:hypothetical protein
MVKGEGIMFISPENLARFTFAKMTSGLHHGSTIHEVMATVIDSVQDIFPWFG